MSNNTRYYPVHREEPSLEWDPSWPNHPRDPTSIPVSRNTSSSMGSTSPDRESKTQLRSRPRPINVPKERHAVVSHLALNDDSDEDERRSGSSDDHEPPSPAAGVAMLSSFFLASV
jgi:hypothetical protein